jgi:capsular exopolysaccharide synthesis family protein
MDQQLSRVNYPAGETFFDVRRYLRVLRERKLSILVVVLLTVGASLLYSFSRTPTYVAESQVLVSTLNIENPALLTGPPNLETEAALVRSTEVARRAAAMMGSSEGPATLLRRVSVSVPADTETLLISFSASAPSTARQGANAVAQAYLDFREEQAVQEKQRLSETYQREISVLRARLEVLDRAVARAPDPAARETALASRALIAELFAQLAGRRHLIRSADTNPGRLIREANRPPSPAGPRPAVMITLAVMVGLFLGVLVAFFRDRVDERLRGRSDLQASTGVPVLGVIPSTREFKNRRTSRLVVIDSPRSPVAEAYRTLGASVLAMDAGQDSHKTEGQPPARTLLLTSPLQAEGKTVTAANLAGQLAQSGRRVLLISADLRKPRLQEFFQIPNQGGLSVALSNLSNLGYYVAPTRLQNLWVLPRGPAVDLPTEALAGDAMRHLLAEVRRTMEIVLIDGPPLLPVADALILASYVDGVLLIVDGRRTTRGAVDQACGALRQMGANLVGAVLNNVDPSRMGPDYLAYGYQDRQTPAAEPEISPYGRGAAPGPIREGPTTT